MRTDQSQTGKTERLWTRAFIALLATQFFVAFNDNLFRWLIIPIGKVSSGWSDNPTRVITLGGVCFLTPFLLFTPYAGYCSDRFSRNRVIIGAKIAELVIILFGIAAILCHSVSMMLAVLFCLGAQSAFFSPAKYSSLPMAVPQSRIAEANGLYCATTLAACIGGQFLGGFLFDRTTRFDDLNQPVLDSGGSQHWHLWAGALLFVAVSGLITSLFIPRFKPAAPGTRFPLNPIAQIGRDLRFLFRQRAVFRIAMASSFFWGLATLAQSNTDFFGTKYLMVSQTHTMVLLVIITVGLAVGALLAGRISRGKILMSLVPASAFLIILFALLLGFTPAVHTDGGLASPLSFPYLYAAGALFLLGAAAEMFDIPLQAAIQVESPPEYRGRVLAAYNFYSFSAMALFMVFFGVLTDKGAFGLTASGVWFTIAVITFPVWLAARRAWRKS
ncbi:MAG: MFS transporter [Thermoguttaceae bacterium]|nr:MFS transporter [Thermoguttaceae bacterium]